MTTDQSAKPNGWALMEANKQATEVMRSMRIDDPDTAEKASDRLYGIWLGATAYETPTGPTATAIWSLHEQTQCVLLSLTKTNPESRADD